MPQTGKQQAGTSNERAVLTVKMTPEQKREFRIRAAKKDKGMSEYARELLLGTPDLESKAAA